MNNGTRKFLILLVLALAGIAVACGLCSLGCQAEIASEISPDMTTAIGLAVDQSREVTRQQITNDLWPMVVILMGSDALKLSALVLVVWFVVRRQLRRANSAK